MASKKNLAVLLIMPFAISMLSFSAISLTFNLIDNDIVSIDWDYKDHEAFALSGSATKYLLTARAINDRNYPTGQTLKWNVYNVNSEEDNHALIYVSGANSYLNTLSEGEVVITVSNDKGNIQKRMNATIYSNNTIVFNTIIKGSQSNIDSNIYYGQYDLVNNSKTLSSFKYEVSALTDKQDSDVKLISHSENITIDEAKSLVRFNYGTYDKIQDSYIEFGFTNPDYIETYRYNFKVVTNGVNVYNYNDLMWCTNKSNNGEIVVLRTNLESDANVSLTPNSVPFGSKGNCNVYTFETRFNQEYIRQWNAFARNSGGAYQTISNKVKVGIRVQKDFYGNGFTINMHNLTYPYDVMQVTDQYGNPQLLPTLASNNLFRGPLPYYTLGDPNKMPIVTAYGQDNIGMYVEGKDITINDLVLKSCDFGNNLANLEYVGTTMEIYGDNITIKNSRLSNGKNVFKSYDSNNVLLDNCILSYSRNFLCMSGSYDYMNISGDELFQFVHEDGVAKLEKVNEYLAPKAMGDNAITHYMYGENEKGHIVEAMRSIQSALDNKRTNTFKGDLTIRDTAFYRSGISSIAFESLFNGPFLFNASPSIIKETIGNYSEQMSQFNIGIPYYPHNVGGVSYPVYITLDGNTRFYDYKTPNLLDINGLVGENISTLASSVAGDSYSISLDKIFPIKDILVEIASQMHATYNGQINSPIAFYGGGLNLSELMYTDSFLASNQGSHLTDVFDVDFLSRYAEIKSQGSGLMANIVGAVLKAVTIVSGFNPFKFALSKDGYLFGEAPQIQDLINNQK